MASTPYSPERGKFSKKGHEAAREQVYPKILGVEYQQLSFDYPAERESDGQEVMDRDLNIDVEVFVEVDHLPQPMHFTFQERWRNPEYRPHQDVTVTEINTITGTKSEHYKISSGFHLYGYYDINIDKIPEAICFNVPDWQVGVIHDAFNTGAGKDLKSKSSFISYKFDQLKEFDCVLAHIKKGEVVYQRFEF